jgi:hypothetical protein
MCCRKASAASVTPDFSRTPAKLPSLRLSVRLSKLQRRSHHLPPTTLIIANAMRSSRATASISVPSAEKKWSSSRLGRDRRRHRTHRTATLHDNSARHSAHHCTVVHADVHRWSEQHSPKPHSRPPFTHLPTKTRDLLMPPAADATVSVNHSTARGTEHAAPPAETSSAHNFRPTLPRLRSIQTSNRSGPEVVATCVTRPI